MKREVAVVDLSSVFPGSAPVLAAWVFGSVARGEAREDSDLDVAVALRDPSAGVVSHRRALLDLTARLEAASGRRVDLAIVSARDPILAHRVFSEGVCVYDANPAARHALEADLIAGFLDWAPSYEAAVDESLRANRVWAHQ